MQHPQLLEYARQQLAKGLSPADIEAHLRGQNWSEEIVAEVLAAAAPDRPVLPDVRPRGKWRHVLGAVALVLVALGAYQLYRHYAVAKVVREKTKFVEFSGRIDGQIDAPDGREFGLLAFKGQLDSSRLEDPRAALRVDFDGRAPRSGALRKMAPETDAHLLGLTLLTVTGGARTIGGVEVRLAEWNTYLRPVRTPFAGDQTAAAMAGLVTALVGPNILNEFWVKVPARPPAEPASGGMLSSESKATWALLFRPTEKIFGESKHLRFIGREPGGDIGGTATEIHRYTIDGPWLTRQLVKAVRQAEVEDKMEILALVQSLVRGVSPEKVTSSLDSLVLSDGELAVWVGKADTLPYRMTIDLSAKEGTRSPLALRLAGEMDIAYIPPVAIEAPGQALDLRQLREQLGFLEGLGNLFR
jgi:hypothetical protein